MSFVFYDTETTGLSKPFDQIVRFAAVRTDAELRELERIELRSRLCPHVIPHPNAMRINRIGIGQLTDPAAPSHYTMMRQISETLTAWSPSIFVGYNSLRFDEEMLRQAFFQTLHPPYLTSLHGNGRADALTLALYACSKLASGIRTALSSDGKRVFRLADFAKANGIDHSHGHEALADVLTTVEICRLVRKKAPDAWNAFARFSRKATTHDFMAGEDGFLLTEFFANEPYHTPVVFLGADPTQRTLCYCLTLDSRTKDFLSAPDDVIRAAMREKPSPVRRVRTNAAPCIQPLWDTDDMEFELSVDELEDLAREVKSDVSQCKRLVGLCSELNTPFPASNHCEQRIYERFPSPSDETLMQEFHKVPWTARPALIERLQDDRLRTLGLRLIYMEAPRVLSAKQQAEVLAHLDQRSRDHDSGPLTTRGALDLCDTLLLDKESDGKDLLLDYKRHLERVSA